jgi:hypothetical protein
MASDWEIKTRSEKCAVSGRPFQDGEFFYTLLFHDKDGFHRQDLSEEAWQQMRGDGMREVFSFWRAKFELPPAEPPEPLAKDTAESLLRRYMQEDDSMHTNARFILAVMLERKRILKQVSQSETPEGRTLVYEHTKTGEVFLIPDPQLRLDQVERVQDELAALLT